MKKFFTIISIVVCLWLIFSWLDVIIHNNPTSQNYKQYSEVNMFTIIGGLYGNN